MRAPFVEVPRGGLTSGSAVGAATFGSRPGAGGANSSDGADASPCPSQVVRRSADCETSSGPPRSVVGPWPLASPLAGRHRKVDAGERRAWARPPAGLDRRSEGTSGSCRFFSLAPARRCTIGSAASTTPGRPFRSKFCCSSRLCGMPPRQGRPGFLGTRRAALYLPAGDERLDWITCCRCTTGTLRAPGPAWIHRLTF